MHELDSSTQSRAAAAPGRLRRRAGARRAARAVPAVGIALLVLLLTAAAALAAPPTNDAFSASETMSGSTATATGTNREAVTADPDTRTVPPWTLPAIDYEAVDGDQPGENNNSVLPSSV